MPAAQSRDLIVLAAAATLAVAITVVGGLLAPPAALPGDGSSLSAAPGGAKAAYLMLARLGYRIERSFEPLADMPALPPGTIVVVASPIEKISEADRRAARRFVEEGGVLLTTGLGGTLLPDFTVTRSPAPDPFTARSTRVYPAARQDSLSKSAPAIRLWREAATGTLKEPYTVLYAEGGETAVAAARFGSGRAIWLAGVHPLANGGIAGTGHVELLLHVVGEPGAGRVVWNEYYHGHARSLWSYLADSPAVALLWQSLAIGLVALASFGRRQGPVRPLAAEQRTSVLEFVDALGALYRRARAAAGAVEVSLQRTRRILASRAGLATAAPDEQIAGAVAERLRWPAARVLEVLREAEEASGNPDLGSEDALVVVRRMQALSARVQGHTAL